MTGEIVNLNKARKAKARLDGEKQAEGNRAKFGVSTPARVKELHEKDQRDRLLDGARRETPGGDAEQEQDGPEQAGPDHDGRDPDAGSPR